MSERTFTLMIALGNDAMQDPLDVADELKTLAGFLENVVGWPDEGGTIIDRNGNLVGGWLVKADG